jgi:hypothetical protein
MSPEQLHRLRIQVKKARYAAEFFSSVYRGKKSAKRCKKILSSLTQLQNCLGGFNDIMTRKALFADIRTRPGRGSTAEQNRQRAFAAGLIIGDQQAQIHKLLVGAKKAYSRFENAKAFWKVPRRPSTGVGTQSLPNVKSQQGSVRLSGETPEHPSEHGRAGSRGGSRRGCFDFACVRSAGRMQPPSSARRRACLPRQMTFVAHNCMATNIA